MNKNNLEKETATQNEQQLNNKKTKREIISAIVNFLADNQLSILESKEILMASANKIDRQRVVPSVRQEDKQNANKEKSKEFFNILTELLDDKLKNH